MPIMTKRSKVASRPLLTPNNGLFGRHIGPFWPPRGGQANISLILWAGNLRFSRNGGCLSDMPWVRVFEHFATFQRLLIARKGYNSAEFS